jgi:acetoin utilization protein AcuB
MRRIEEVMTTGPLATVRPTDTIGDVARLIAEREVSHVIVLANGEVVGVMCACDLDGPDRQARVDRHMSRSPSTASVGATAFDAARCMLEQGISCLPVVRGGDLVGIVTLSDLRRAGVLERAAGSCAACGDRDHVRCERRHGGVGFCLDCRRSSLPPGDDDDLGGG